MKLIMAKFRIQIHYSGRKWYSYMPFANANISYASMKFKKIG
jgi:hypothetical protein